jgi:hypothetical protein
MLYFFKHQELGISAQKRVISAQSFHLPAVFGRSLTGVFFKHFGKITGVIVAAHPAYLADGFIAELKHPFREAQTQIFKVGHARLRHFIIERIVKSVLIYREFFQHTFQGDLFI